MFVSGDINDYTHTYAKCGDYCAGLIYFDDLCWLKYLKKRQLQLKKVKKIRFIKTTLHAIRPSDTLGRTVTRGFSAWRHHRGYHASHHFTQYFYQTLENLLLSITVKAIICSEHTAMYFVMHFTDVLYANINCCYWYESVANSVADVSTNKELLNPYPVVRWPVKERKKWLYVSSCYKFNVRRKNLPHGLLQRGNAGLNETRQFYLVNLITFAKELSENGSFLHRMKMVENTYLFQ